MDAVASQTAATRQLRTLDINQILKCLPHRYPFLMIDRIIEMDGDDAAIGIKNISVNEPMFLGHFPEHPIFPGVLIIEGMAQTAGAIVIAHDIISSGREIGDASAEKKVVLLITIDKAKFRKPTQPGDRIEYHIKKVQRRRAVGRYQATAMVDGVVVAEAEVGAMIAGA